MFTVKASLFWACSLLLGVPYTQAMQPLEGTSFSVTAIGVDSRDNSNLLVPVPDDVIAIVRFTPGGVEAELNPCGSMWLDYETDTQGSLTIKDIYAEIDHKLFTPLLEQIQSGEYCQDSSAEDLAKSFLQALYAVAFIESVQDGTGKVVMKDEQGSSVLELISCSVESDLAGTYWYPITMEKDGATILPLDKAGVSYANLNAKFDGCSLSGKSGCNNYGYTYKTTGRSNLALAYNFGTRMACMSDDGVQVEATYLNVLDRVASFEMDSEKETLLLIDSDGKQLAEFAACPPASLETFIWEAVVIQSTLYNTGTGKEISARFEDNPMTFVDGTVGVGGTMSGNTGCSEYQVEYTASDDGSISFGIPTIAQPGCARDGFESDFEYENAIERSAKFWEALQQIMSYEIIPCSEELLFTGADGFSLLDFRNGMLSF